ncbi:hypothetical protein [Humibacter ginsenosidimutans]|uniref:hypothetical protein n=1 Tax=Humibacter ginsenosidimutans TaxID=2599293 RepID=UPI00143D400D|nr:hypothetical protein [Humibacter ginsenosidimutans]
MRRTEACSSAASKASGAESLGRDPVSPGSTVAVVVPAGIGSMGTEPAPRNSGP